MTFSAYGADYENENVAGDDSPEAGEQVAAPAERPPVQPTVAACEAPAVAIMASAVIMAICFICPVPA